MKPQASYWKGKQVCVTGGTGFLGFQVVKQLVELGARVRVLALPPRNRHPLTELHEVQIRFGDVCDPHVVRAAVTGCETIFHTAGSVVVWGSALQKMYDVHCVGTRHVIDAADPKTTIAYTSSVVAVGGSRGGRVLDERSAFNLAHLKVDYVRAKRDAEGIALNAAAHGQRIVVVNPGYLVGPEDYEDSVMGRFCRRFWNGRVPLAPPGGLNLVDVRDVATGHLLAVENGSPGHRYILGGQNVRFRQFLLSLAEAGGLRPRAIPRMPHWCSAMLAMCAELRASYSGREPYPSLQQHRLGRYYWFCNSTLARHALGYSPRPLSESLADMYHWHAKFHSFRLRGARRLWMGIPKKQPRRSPDLASLKGSGDYGAESAPLPGSDATVAYPNV